MSPAEVGMVVGCVDEIGVGGVPAPFRCILPLGGLGVRVPGVDGLRAISLVSETSSAVRAGGARCAGVAMGRGKGLGGAEERELGIVNACAL
jgi:hypothetical protein